MSNYSLLGIAWHINGGNAGEATVRYVDRISNLNGIQTVLIATGGNSGKGFDTMTQRCKAANGVVINSIARAATDNARRAGAQIQP